METVEEKVGEKLGNYRLVREAGRGAMSIVYEAVDTRVERKVALKVGLSLSHPSPEARERLIARLKREARAVARLSHPNIVTIHDVGEQDGQHFLVMEYLEGVTLRERMDEGPLSLAEASRILDQVAAALDAAHARGVVHRDIKPSNVMLLPGGHVKVMDLRLGSQAAEYIKKQNATIDRSPSYMAPEQVRGQVSASSDVWAVGVLLYEMLLAGRAPSRGTASCPCCTRRFMKPPAAARDAGRGAEGPPARAGERPGETVRLAGELAEAFRAAAPAPAEAPRRRQRKRAAAGGGRPGDRFGMGRTPRRLGGGAASGRGGDHGSLRPAEQTPGADGGDPAADQPPSRGARKARPENGSEAAAPFRGRASKGASGLKGTEGGTNRCGPCRRGDRTPLPG